jgi:oxygen-independent coproporphyrinogen-3 oxidase
MINSDLVEKYNVAVPRYTSYPTVPFWSGQVTESQWKEKIKNRFELVNGEISLYIHLPYCESLCTFCGCNKKISISHDVEIPYIAGVLQEWEIYKETFESKPKIKEIHLGGGTPTFFSPDSLKLLLDSIIKDSELSKDYDFSCEVHPRVTTYEHLETLAKLGFKRLSIGIQDFDERIQDVINRKQTLADVERVVEDARKLGYESINFDLVYGLPYQTEESIDITMKETKRLRPDRIAMYSYAHVPWKSKGQRKFDETDLPSPSLKRFLYEKSSKELQEMGYEEIGMDHFALKTDTLYKAMENKTLHRNFMGYTHASSDLLIGLGASSISDTWDAYIQNEKDVNQYLDIIKTGKLPIITGHILSNEEMIVRRKILDLMCKFETTNESIANKEGLDNLIEMEKDNLVDIGKEKIEVTHQGKAFIRNICASFDPVYWSKKSENMFSKSV